MKIYLAIATLLILGACSNEVTKDTSTEKTNAVEESSVNETTEDIEEAPESEIKTNLKVETLSDIADYFELNGHMAEIFSEKFAGQIGAKAGVGIEIDGDVMEVYEFDLSNPDSLERLNTINESGTLLSNEAISNGNFVMIGYESHPDFERIIEIFKSFNGGTQN
ncbi:hypothetical protein ACFY5J_27125 [Peribacillus butanolivorans]|uniref:hypothetical protein n=1 Tax=Peribacillus butanolivorans TaxID=421767 RepID=UPI0036A648B5